MTLFIEPGSPWANRYLESFNGKMCDELLNGEIFDTLLEAKVILAQRVKQHNELHSAGHQRQPRLSRPRRLHWLVRVFVEENGTW